MERRSLRQIVVGRTLAIVKPDVMDKREEIEDVILASGFTILQSKMAEESYCQIDVGRTLALIKPDAVAKSEEIEDIILTSGFSILQKRKLQLSPEQCSDFYADQYGRLFFPALTAFMSSGPIIAMTLARDNAIEHWKSIIGPTNSIKAKETNPESLRAKYGTSDMKNAVHGSESFQAAEREIKFMFPNTVIEFFPKAEAAEEYLSKYVNPTLTRGITELCKRKPLEPCIWLADWLIKNNPNRPQIYEGFDVAEEQ